jgi:hypothetical protein
MVIFGAMNIGEPGTFLPSVSDRRLKKRRVLIVSILGDGRTRVHSVDGAQHMVDTLLEYGHKDIDTARVYGDDHPSNTWVKCT